MNSREITRKIERDGWQHVRTTGDQWHFKHPSKVGLVTVPHPRKDIPAGRLRSIEKQAAIRLR
jgi:predicted RNA binding protein YcfA (HicA-like mRNA interferase family)